MAEVTVRYWAGAREVAGVEHERVEASSVGDVVALLGARGPALAAVLRRSSLLVDGQVVRGGALDAALAEGQTVEVLPPFAGG